MIQKHALYNYVHIEKALELLGRGSGTPSGKESAGFKSEVIRTEERVKHGHPAGTKPADSFEEMKRCCDIDRMVHGSTETVKHLTDLVHQQTSFISPASGNLSPETDLDG